MALIQSRGLAPRVVDYLKTPPSAVELDAVLRMLGIEPRALMRKVETEYADIPADASRQQLIDAMITHPKLIERPVVIHNGKAVVGRPPEAVLGVL